MLNINNKDYMLMKSLAVLGAGLFLINVTATLLPSQRVLAAEEDKTFSDPAAPKPYSMNVKLHRLTSGLL